MLVNLKTALNCTFRAVFVCADTKMLVSHGVFVGNSPDQGLVDIHSLEPSTDATEMKQDDT